MDGGASVAKHNGLSVQRFLKAKILVLCWCVIDVNQQLSTTPEDILWLFCYEVVEKVSHVT